MYPRGARPEALHSRCVFSLVISLMVKIVYGLTLQQKTPDPRLALVFGGLLLVETPY